jgi:hypothetical protein
VFIRNLHQLRSERRAYELAVLMAAAKVLDHVCYCSSVLCCTLLALVRGVGELLLLHTIKICVHLIKQVKWRRITLLDRKDKREGA